MNNGIDPFPNLCLTADLGLPDGDGLELAHEAKEHHNLRTIALTGRTDPDQKDAGLASRFDFYLTKPVDFHALRVALGVPADSA